MVSEVVEMNTTSATDSEFIFMMFFIIHTPRRQKKKEGEMDV